MNFSLPQKRLISNEPDLDYKETHFSSHKYPKFNQEHQKPKENLVHELLKDIVGFFFSFSQGP
jgi:hypothetical protein